jgi:hypothetical protein
MLHAERITRWVLRQSRMLIDLLSDPHLKLASGASELAVGVLHKLQVSVRLIINTYLRVLTDSRKPKPNKSHELLQLLKTEASLAKEIPVRQARLRGGRNKALREALMRSAAEHPLTLEELRQYPEGAAVATEISDLLEERGETREQWHRWGSKYMKAQREVALESLYTLQSSIVKVITERNAELDILHRRVRGQKQAKKFIVQLNNRWKQLVNFVKKYNVEVSKIQAFELPEKQARIRRLVASDLRERGLECEELWDVDRMLTTDDCTKRTESLPVS